MSKFLKAIQIGLQVLNALQNGLVGLPAEFGFEWKGKLYRLTLVQSSLPVDPTAVRK